MHVDKRNAYALTFSLSLCRSDIIRSILADAYVVLVRRGSGQLSVPRIQRHHGMGPPGDVSRPGRARGAIRGHEGLADISATDHDQAGVENDLRFLRELAPAVQSRTDNLQNFLRTMVHIVILKKKLFFPTGVKIV